jgi:hypothetical protein
MSKNTSFGEEAPKRGGIRFATSASKCSGMPYFVQMVPWQNGLCMPVWFNSNLGLIHQKTKGCAGSFISVQMQSRRQKVNEWGTSFSSSILRFL